MIRWFAVWLCVAMSATIAWAQQPPPTRVAVIEVFEKEVSPTTPLVGVVDFDQSSGISSEISGLMVSHQHELSTLKVATPFAQCKYDREHFNVSRGIVQFWSR